MSDSNWFSDLFIEEAKAAKTTREYMSGEKINNQDKTLTENGEYTFDEGYTGLGVVTVDVPEPDIKEPVFESLSVTENGLYTPPDGVDGYDSVAVNVVSSGGSDDGSFKAVIERTATEVTLPSDLTKIGEYAFYNCTNLSLTSLPSGITKIGTYAFYNCTNLSLTSLPSGITNIGSNAFYGCTNLSLTSLPSGVTSIGSSVFRSCTNLALTSLPDGLTSVGAYSFQSCVKLVEITFNSKPSINTSAFISCTNLLTINVPWAEGEVSGAPWGATNATINYNYVPQPPADKYSWDAVLASIDAGTYATDYAIGDTVPLDLGSEGLINMQIAAFDTDDLADGSGKARITWIAKELLATPHRWNPGIKANDDGTYQEGTGTVGGWEKSELRAYLKDTINPMIPEYVRNRIKVVSKQTRDAYDVNGKGFVQNTAEDIWLPNGYYDINSASQMYGQLLNGDTTRIKYIVGTTTPGRWWLRAADVKEMPYTVKESGSIHSGYPDTQYYICLCFCT